MARARSVLATLNRAVTELSTPSRTADLNDILQNLRDDLQRQRG